MLFLNDLKKGVSVCSELLFLTKTDCKVSSCIFQCFSLSCKKQSSEGVCEKAVLRNFTKFTGKHLCLRPAALLKKRLRHRCFPVNLVKFVRTPFLTEHIWWLLLYKKHGKDEMTNILQKLPQIEISDN